MNATENSAVVSFSSDVLREIIQINYIASLAVGIVFNSTLIYLILKRSPTSLQLYCPILLVAAFTDSYTIFISGACQMDIRIVSTGSLLVFRGPLKYLPEVGQWIVYGFLTSCLTLEVLILLLENYFRYYFMKTRNTLPKSHLILLILVVVCLSFGQVPIILFNYLYYPEDHTEYHERWSPDNLNSVVNAKYSKRGPILKILGQYQTSLSLGAFVLAVVIAGLSVWLMRKEVANMTKKTRSLLNQFTKTLVTRMVLFGISSVFPRVISQLSDVAPFLAMNPLVMNTISVILFTWFPTINSIFSLVFIGAYRQTLLRAFRVGAKVLHLRSSAQISTIRIRSTS
ncbi:hypothetical protein M3Y95_01160200 [Aphelenchoides besseyi]|nr:hypothetical protein M3Y95_01160200 [Aphelenchoides besseyi]